VVKRRASKKLAFLLVIGSSVLAASAATSTAEAHTYGQKSLTQGVDGCCSNPLWGTRVTIKPQGTFSSSSAQCIEFYSNANNSDVTKWIQTGMYRCFQGVSIDGTCPGGLDSYVEVKPSSGVAPSCTDLGSEGSTTHKYTVDSTSGTTWTAYVDGIARGSSLSMGAASKIDETGEFSGDCFTFTASGGFAYTSPQWQRWTGSTWFTIQSSDQLLDCGWTISGSLSSGWTAAH
jgi:hypothetical protein